MYIISYVCMLRGLVLSGHRDEEPAPGCEGAVLSQLRERGIQEQDTDCDLHRGETLIGGGGDAFWGSRDSVLLVHVMIAVVGGGGDVFWQS